MAEEFSRIQNGLVTKLLVTVRPLDREYFRDVPDGSLDFEGETWSYRRHGAGVAFRSAHGVTVDAHVAMADWPAAIDAWRLYLYFDSMGVREILYRGSVFAIDGEDNVEGLLKKMVAAGALRVVKDKRRPNRTYYVPAAS